MPQKILLAVTGFSNTASSTPSAASFQRVLPKQSPLGAQQWQNNCFYCYRFKISEARLKGPQGMSKEFSPTDFQAVLDDEEGLTSLFIRWCDVGGYLCIAREQDEEELYCEYCDQSNGFYSKTICSRWLGEHIEFKLSGDESFSQTERLQTLIIRMEIQGEEVRQCIELLFKSGANPILTGPW